jgi:hypothetical protein
METVASECQPPLVSDIPAWQQFNHFDEEFRLHGIHIFSCFI